MLAVGRKTECIFRKMKMSEDSVNGEGYKKRRLSILRRKYLVLTISCACLLCYVLSQNLFAWACITNGMNPDWRKELANFLSPLIIPGAFLLPYGLCMAFRKRLLSEKWMLLLFSVALFVLPLGFGFKNPYFEDKYIGRPFDAYIDDLVVCSVSAMFLLGPILVFFHFKMRNKKRMRPPLSRRICALLCAILISVILVWLFLHSVANAC